MFIYSILLINIINALLFIFLGSFLSWLKQSLSDQLVLYGTIGKRCVNLKLATVTTSLDYQVIASKYFLAAGHKIETCCLGCTRSQVRSLSFLMEIFVVPKSKIKNKGG